LIFVHGFRHTREYEVHAAVLVKSEAQLLVSQAHLLLYCNNRKMSLPQLMGYLAAYTMPVRLLIKTGINVGYHCGHLHSLAISRHVWSRYALTLFLHPDVYLLPRFFSVLESQLTDTHSPHETQSTTDSLSPVSPSVWNHSSLNAIQRAPASFFGSPTTLLSHGKRRPAQFLTDLFAFRTAPFARRVSPQQSNAWSNATAFCIHAHQKPEIALASTVLSLQMVTRPLLGRSHGSFAYLLSTRLGVWHSHSAAHVAQQLLNRSHGL
jgi:hypothetical protein